MRCACGRAYYAAFVIARDLIRVRRSVGTSRSVHRDVVDLLKSSGDAEVRGAGVSLERLRATRNSADYELARPAAHFSKPIAALAILQAESIISTLRSAVKRDRHLGIS